SPQSTPTPRVEPMPPKKHGFDAAPCPWIPASAGMRVLFQALNAYSMACGFCFSAGMAGTQVGWRPACRRMTSLQRRPVLRTGSLAGKLPHGACLGPVGAGVLVKGWASLQILPELIACRQAPAWELGLLAGFFFPSASPKAA